MKIQNTQNMKYNQKVFHNLQSHLTFYYNKIVIFKRAFIWSIIWSNKIWCSSKNTKFANWQSQGIFLHLRIFLVTKRVNFMFPEKNFYNKLIMENLRPLLFEVVTPEGDPRLQVFDFSFLTMKLVFSFVFKNIGAPKA